jgi:hypothetical protein
MLAAYLPIGLGDRVKVQEPVAKPQFRVWLEYLWMRGRYTDWRRRRAS